MGIFILSVATYLLLAWSGGGIDPMEVSIAVLLGLLLFFAGKSWGGGRPLVGFNPGRIIAFFRYLLGPFAVALYHANIDVAKRVISGDLRPGIVKVSSGLKNPAALTLLANSITLTPGTLSVDVDESDNSLYIHWIYVTRTEECEEAVYGPFADWARRIAE